MPDTKISALTDGSPAGATDQIAVNQGGTSKRVNANTVGALGTGRFVKQTVATTSGAGSGNFDPATTKIRFSLTGGGGGGAGVAGNSGNAAFSGGGCAGGCTEHVLTVTGGASFSYNVGAGGTGAANNAVGGAGGETNFTTAATIWRANGGAGGDNMANGLSNLATTAHANTAANAANTPSFAVGGQAGEQGWRFSGVIGHSGDGGCSIWGGAGRGTKMGVATAGVKGENSVGNGSGGAGGCGNSNANGGTGSNGIMILEEFS